MIEKKKRNWRARYLTIEAFGLWKKNDFRHLKWEVHGIGVILLVVLGLVTAMFSIALGKLFG